MAKLTGKRITRSGGLKVAGGASPKKGVSKGRFSLVGAGSIAPLSEYNFGNYGKRK